MNLSEEHPNRDTELEAPRRLVADLRGLYGHDVPVPPEVDEAVLATARGRFARRRPRVVVLRWAAVAAAAACVLLAVMLSFPARQPSTMPPAQQPLAAYEDFDGNGRVDILDAFALARLVETSAAVADDWDLTGDGAVDGQDVDVIAFAAVSLGRGTLQ